MEFKSLARVTCLILIIAIFSLVSSCSQTGNTNVGSNTGGGGFNLQISQMSPVPVVNGAATEFYVNVTNTGTQAATNLQWALSDAAIQKASLFTRVKGMLSGGSQLQGLENGLTILDASDVTNINAGQSGRMLLRAAGNINGNLSNLLQVTNSSSNNEIASLPISAYSYTAQVSSVLADTLLLSPLSDINFASGFAAYNISLINVGAGAVSWSAADLLSQLPAGASFAPGNCPNPIPQFAVCQIYLTFSTSGASADSSLTVPIQPYGTMLNSDGSSTPLPLQNSATSIGATSAQVANAQILPPSSSVVDANTQSTTPGIGYISNTGVAPLQIGQISVSNQQSISLHPDNCSGRSLAVGEICSYTINLDYASITSSGSSILTIPYFDGKANKSVSSVASWNYVASSQAQVTAVLTPSSINLGDSTIILSVSTQLGPLTLTNNSSASNGGDATIRVSLASLIPANTSNLSFSMGSSGEKKPCIPSSSDPQHIILAAGSSCSYNLVISGSQLSDLIATPINLSWQSKVYTSSSTTPNWGSVQTSSIALNIEVVAAQAQLVVQAVNSGEDNFANAEVASSYQQQYVLTNIGTVAVKGPITLNSSALPGFSASNLSDCSDLAPSTVGQPVQSCTFILDYQPLTPTVTSANLNQLLLAYNNTRQEVSTALPNQSVNAVAAAVQPNIVVNTTISGCGAGDGSSEDAICYVNSNSPAAGLRVVISYSNSSPEAVANNFTVDTLSPGIPSAYTVVNNSCNGLNLNPAKVCKLELKIADASAATPNYNLNSDIVRYSYTYGAKSSGFILTNPGKFIDVNDPALSIATIPDVILGKSSQTTVTLSNWYSSSTASAMLSLIGPDGTSNPRGLMVAPLTCDFVSSNGSCSVTISADAGAPIGNGQTLKVTLAGSVKSANFAVPGIIFVTNAAHNGNFLYYQGQNSSGIAGADQFCNNSANQPQGIPVRDYKALLLARGIRSLDLNWVLKPKLSYYRSDLQTLIATTMNNSTLPFNLTNSIATVDNKVYTGATSSNYWVSSGEYDCGGWTIDDINFAFIGANGIANSPYGIADMDNASYWADYGIECDQPAHLYCVSQ